LYCKPAAKDSSRISGEAVAEPLEASRVCSGETWVRSPW
jgi:hypothetical protein